MFAGMDEEIELGIVQSIGLRSAGQDEDIRGYKSSCCMHHPRITHVFIWVMFLHTIITTNNSQI